MGEMRKIAFGRRRSVLDGSIAYRHSPPHEPEDQSADLWRKTVLEGEPVRTLVRFSWRSAFLAGLVVSCLQAGSLVAAMDGASEIAPGFAVDLRGSTLGPAFIALKLISGYRAALPAILFAHLAAWALANRTFMVFACAGATGSILWAAALGAVSHHQTDWLAAAMVGAAAGALYRLFTGR